MSIIGTTKAADEVSGRGMPRALEEVTDASPASTCSAPPPYSHPAGKVNTWKPLVTTRFLRAPGGCQAPLKYRDLDSAAHLEEVKNHSKLSLIVLFIKVFLRQCTCTTENRSDILPQMKLE